MKALTALLLGWKDYADLPRSHVAGDARAAMHPAQDKMLDAGEDPAPGRVAAVTLTHSRSDE